MNTEKNRKKGIKACIAVGVSALLLLGPAISMVPAEASAFQPAACNQDAVTSGEVAGILNDLGLNNVQGPNVNLTNTRVAAGSLCI